MQRDAFPNRHRVRIFTSALALTASLLAQPTLVQAEDWAPSKYGAEDSLGALNLMTPERVLAATQLVQQGKTYALGVLTGSDTPAFGTRSFNLVALAAGDGSGSTLGTNKATFNDDFVSTWLGIGSQIDGLGHLGVEHRYYNGVHVSEFLRADGLTRFGTHELPPIVARGVLLDLAALRGVEVLAAGSAINRADLEAAAKRQDVALREGDVVLLHTGWQRYADEDPEKFLAGAPGLGLEGAEYLAGLGAVAIGADTWALEVLPSEDPEHAFPVHQLLLSKNGVYILENMNTAALAADQGWEFMFVLGVPRLVGAVQMIVNPVAIR